MKQQADLTIICICHDTLPQKKVNGYRQACGQLIVVCLNEAALHYHDGFLMVPWHREKGKVAALNEAIQKAAGTHILWIEENETLPEISHLEGKTFCPARIANSKAETPAVNWQIRLFPNPNSGNPFFTGHEIPELRQNLSNREDWQLDYSLTIDREGELFPVEDIQREVNKGINLPMAEFWEGILASREKQFTRAVRCFKNMLKKGNLTYWNRLAALNCLANALMENLELQKARETAEKSLAITPHQRAPYLTIYQYYNLKGEDHNAYQQLVKYQQIAESTTEANWDVFLPTSHVAFLMAEISYHQGLHEQAFKHYEQFFVCKNGQVGQPVLEKLFLYAVKLNKREKAIGYFEALYGEYLTGNINDKNQSVQIQIRQALSLITDKGWYDFASGVYRKLVSLQPEDRSLQHGLIRTLVKNEQMDKAQSLVESIG